MAFQLSSARAPIPQDLSWTALGGRGGAMAGVKAVYRQAQINQQPQHWDLLCCGRRASGAPTPSRPGLPAGPFEE